MKPALLLLAVSFTVPIACGGHSEESREETACVRGEARDCTCPGGTPSHQICEEEGNGYEPCQCELASGGTTAAGGNGGDDSAGGSTSSGGKEAAGGTSTGGHSETGGEGGMGGSGVPTSCSTLNEDESHANCECSPDEYLCLGSSLQRCRSTGDGFDEEELCDAAVLCDADGAECLPDLQAPTVPADLATGAIEARAVALTWSQASDNATAGAELTYEIYWSQESGAQDLMDSPAITVAGETTATVGGLPAFEDVYFVVVAVDEAGNRSDPSAEVHAKTLFSYLSNIEVGIYASQCATSGCHSGEFPAAALNLTPGVSYDQMVEVAAKAEVDSGFLLVKPNQPDESSLVTRIERTDGYAMPPAGEGLSEEEIDLIRYWIEIGAPRN